MKKSSLFPLISILVLFQVNTLATEFIVKNISDEEEKDGTWIALLHVFSSDSMGLTGGVVGILFSLK